MKSLAALSLLSTAAMATVPPPPAVRPGSEVTLPSMLVWTAGAVRCEGTDGGAADLTAPQVPRQLVWGVTAARPLRYRFTIDASGRPLDIVRTDADFVPFADDVAPALAASRFAGGARRGCGITYTPVQQSLATVPVADLIAYTMAPASGPLPQAGWDRIVPAGATCAAMPRPAPLLRAFPDFQTLSGTPGVRDWTLLAYDTDRYGRPRRIRPVAGTANRALDAAGAKAVAASRFTGGARTGCLYPYWLRPARLPAPPPPEESAFRDAAATCPERHDDWATAPTLRFPEPYRRRMIEGWAVVRYDIATWGEVGNVTVLASEPGEDFGRQAVQVIRSARAKPSAQGLTGCIDRVRFIMGPDTMPPEPEQP